MPTRVEAVLLRKFGGQGKIKTALEMVEDKPDAYSRQVVLPRNWHRPGAADSIRASLQQATGAVEAARGPRPGGASGPCGISLPSLAQLHKGTEPEPIWMPVFRRCRPMVAQWLTGTVNMQGGNFAGRDQYNTYINEQTPQDEH